MGIIPSRVCGKILRLEYFLFLMKAGDFKFYSSPDMHFMYTVFRFSGKDSLVMKHKVYNSVPARLWNWKRTLIILHQSQVHSSIFSRHYQFSSTAYEPRQANLCLRAFFHDKFQLRIPSHSEGPGIWLSVRRFLLIHCLYERAAEVLARLRGCAGSPEPSLLGDKYQSRLTRSIY